MIEVYIGSNLNREKEILPHTTTLREALESKGIDYSIGQVNLDGATVMPGELDKSFQDFGITTKCFLVVTVKSDGAVR